MRYKAQYKKGRSLKILIASIISNMNLIKRKAFVVNPEAYMIEDYVRNTYGVSHDGVTCPICGYKAKNKFGLFKHIMNRHSEELEVY
jgi:hypothetical protein